MKYKLSNEGQLFLRNKRVSTAEMRILNELFNYEYAKEIAQSLCVDTKTIKFHLTRVNKRLGTKSRPAIMILLKDYFIPSDTVQDYLEPQRVHKNQIHPYVSPADALPIGRGN